MPTNLLDKRLNILQIKQPSRPSFYVFFYDGIRWQVRGVSKKAGLQCVLQTVASRGMILPLPVVVLPAVLVGLLKKGGVMPTNPRARMWAQVRLPHASIRVVCMSVRFR